jgi:hypothetical protein
MSATIQIIEPQEDEADVAPPPATLNATRAHELAGVNEAFDFVEGLLGVGASSLVYGPSNVGKSFLILDLAACVATGRSFRDELEVDQGGVLYLSLEGKSGMQNRLEALKRRGVLADEPPLFVSFDHVSLTGPSIGPTYGQIVAETCRKIEREQGVSFKLIIVDTLSRAMAGGDENSGRDMMIAVGEIDLIRGETGAHVMIVHHSGKDETRGARGSSTLRAAVDTEIELSRPEGSAITTMRVTKQRDFQIGPPMPFSLEVVELGTDRRGNPINTCVVKHEDEIMAGQPRGRGRPKSSVSKTDLLNLLPQPSTKAWQEAASHELGVGKTAFYELRKIIEASKAAVHGKTDGWKIPQVIFRTDQP